MPIRRIVIAIDTSPGSVAALEAAAELAAVLQVDMLGLFVEDINLVRWSRLPFARQVGTTSGAYRRLEGAELERQLRVQAQHAQDILKSTADRFGIRTSFRIARGIVPKELLVPLETGDVLSLGVHGRLPPKGRWLGSTAQSVVRTALERLLLLPPGARPLGRIGVVFDGTPASIDALEIGAAIASGRAHDLHVYCVAPTDEAARPLYQEARERLGPAAVRAHLHRLEPDDASGAALAVRSAGVSTLIMPDLAFGETVETMVTQFPGCLLITRVGAPPSRE